MGALNYNMKKLNHPDPNQRAVLLDSNFASLNPIYIKAEVEAVRLLRPGLNKYVYHTSLNFSNDELLYLTNEKLKTIASDYLQGLGFINNQYLVFRHYDADHPHIHLLVNRIGFDGTVVSDSNNYKRSEAILRKLEYQYNLVAVAQSKYRAVEQGNKVTIERNNFKSQKAPNKNEIEMAIRTGKPSDKMVLQNKLSKLLKIPNLTIGQFISQCEKQGINLLFNQASTGRVSGITYFHDGFKIKGQSLGDRYKWAELIKHIAYEQTKDGAAVSGENSRTKTKYGDLSATATEYRAKTRPDHRNRTDYLHTANTNQSQLDIGDTAGTGKIKASDGAIQTGSNETSAINDNYAIHPSDLMYSDNSVFNIEITDDIDDEAINGRNRHRQKKARSNTR